VASGGIARLEDLHKLADMVPLGIEGAIVGRALYDGAFTLAEAITAYRRARRVICWPGSGC